MPGPVQLSVLLTTHAKTSDFSSLLLHLLRFDLPRTEIIIVNDGTDDNYTSEIHQLLQNNASDSVFLLEHDTPRGRGYCLNEALAQASGMLVWAPVKANRLNESLLKNALRRFQSEPVGLWTLDYRLPDQSAGWIRDAEESGLPDDTCFVWNREFIRSDELFFNPFLQTHHAAELALRLYENTSWRATDPFFVMDEHQSAPLQSADKQEMLLSLLRNEKGQEQRADLIARLQQPQQDDTERSDDLLQQARQQFDRGEPQFALDLLNRFLRLHPDHYEATRLKVATLESLRRHVEAAEIKHRLKKQAESVRREAERLTQPETPEEPAAVPEPKPEEPSEKEESIELSVIIPTAGAGQPLLESALINLEERVNHNRTELIVIDNASTDDTFEYLDQLKERKFLNIRVITNHTNRGFAASVNQGLETASAPFIMVMHNDVSLAEQTPLHLMEALSRHPDIALAAPVLDKSDHPHQVQQENEKAEILEVYRADSCCFMIRNDNSFRFDESYGLCYFEMDDFCRQIAKDGHTIAVIPSASVSHQQAATLSMMGLRMAPELKWKNRDIYMKKWGEPKSFVIPEQGTHPDRFLRLGFPEDPAAPDSKWVNAVQDYLTDETRTEILNTDWSYNELVTIISTLILADERELLRTLEDRLDQTDLDPALVILFLHYYYNKNIYSRCRHYLKKADGHHPMFDLCKLKILVADKELDNAAPMLKKLMEKYPASPDLFQVAGDLYKQTGNTDEAKSFYALASQIDPFRFAPEHEAFELRH